jgi:hypothetical protein
VVRGGKKVLGVFHGCVVGSVASVVIVTVIVIVIVVVNAAVVSVTVIVGRVVAVDTETKEHWNSCCYVPVDVNVFLVVDNVAIILDSFNVVVAVVSIVVIVEFTNSNTSFKRKHVGIRVEGRCQKKTSGRGGVRTRTVIAVVVFRGSDGRVAVVVVIAVIVAIVVIV